MLVLREVTEHTPRLCREHGEQKARSYLLKTSFLGWWGIISFFTNFGAIATNHAALRAYRRLAPPTGEVQLRGPSPAQARQNAAQWRFLRWLTVAFAMLIVVGVVVTMLTS